MLLTTFLCIRDGCEIPNWFTGEGHWLLFCVAGVMDRKSEFCSLGVALDNFLCSRPEVDESEFLFTVGGGTGHFCVVGVGARESNFVLCVV